MKSLFPENTASKKFPFSKIWSSISRVFDMEQVSLMSNLGPEFASDAAEKVQEAQETQKYIYYSRRRPVQGDSILKSALVKCQFTN